MKTILITLILTGFVSSAFAVEGLTPVTLSPKERTLLKEYAEGSRNALQTALDDAKGKSGTEQIEIYKEAILEVVKNSYNKSRGGELLMRFILNQALQLTVGDSSRKIEGILTETFNPDIVNVIYRDSIKLAIEYSDEDIKTIQKRNFAFDYNKMAFVRLHFIQRWWSRSILDIDLKSRFLRAGLEHWHTTVAQPQNLGKAALAVQILKVEAALKKVNEYSAASKERFLQGVIEKVLKIEEKQRRKAEEKLREEQEEESNNTVSIEPTEKTKLFIDACSSSRMSLKNKNYCLNQIKEGHRILNENYRHRKIKICSRKDNSEYDAQNSCLKLVFHNPDIDSFKLVGCSHSGVYTPGMDSFMTPKGQVACYGLLMSSPSVARYRLENCAHKPDEESEISCLEGLKY